MESHPDPAPRKSRWFDRGFLWSALWGLLAVLHVTQAIWTSRGQAVPGDLGDGRFNQLILEHGYQSLAGVYDWVSPSQFFPQKGTLTYSDTHAGTLPIYAAFRLGGLSMERALQGWFLVIAILNAFAATRLFAAIGISRVIAGPLVFAATSSAVWVWLAGVHLQTLPYFPMLFMWTHLAHWIDDRRGWRIVAAAGWFAWQFAAAPYLAFFAFVLTAAIAACHWVFARTVMPPETKTEKQPPAPSKVAATLVALIGLTLAVIAGRIYLHSASMGVARAFLEVVVLAPTPSSWFVAPPVHFWWPAGPPSSLDNAWLSGVLPFLFLPAILTIGWTQRKLRAGAYALTLAVSAVLVMAFFTKWNANGASAWLSVAEYIPSLRAFRASGRIAPLTFLLLIAACGLILTLWQRSGKAGPRRWIPAIFATLIALETLAHQQPRMDLANAEFRTNAVIAAWKAAGDRPVLAYAFGYVNQPPPWLHLDAWSAALRLKRATVNGYTGGVPSSVWPFIWNPTVANAHSVLADNHVNPADVTIIDHLAPADAATLGLDRQAHLPIPFLTGFQPQPSAWTLFGPLETFEVNGRVMYQLTPPAALEFALPDQAMSLDYRQAMREGSYNGPGESDGIGMTWVIQMPDAAEVIVFQEHFDPRTRPEHRGVVLRQISLPAGNHRVLSLRIDRGPQHDGRWDWPLFGDLLVH